MVGALVWNFGFLSVVSLIFPVKWQFNFTAWLVVAWQYSLVDDNPISTKIVLLVVNLNCHTNLHFQIGVLWSLIGTADRFCSRFYWIADGNYFFQFRSFVWLDWIWSSWQKLFLCVVFVLKKGIGKVVLRILGEYLNVLKGWRVVSLQ